MSSLSTHTTKDVEMQIPQATKKTKEKKIKNVILMGPVSYEATSVLNNERQERVNKAFEKVKNKTFTKDDLRKTKICRNKDCSWGSDCNYAHSVEELQVHDCGFGDDCKHVYIDSGTVHNSKTGKICRYKHTSESMEQCKIRIGITSDAFNKMQDVPLPPRKNLNAPSPKIDLTPTPLASYPPLGPPPLPPLVLPQAPPQAPPPPPILPPPQMQQPVQNTRVIQVPKELALQALEMAMKSGDGNIRIEFI